MENTNELKMSENEFENLLESFKEYTPLTDRQLFETEESSTLKKMLYKLDIEDKEELENTRATIVDILRERGVK